MPDTAEKKAAWAAYMREYRRRKKPAGPTAAKRRGIDPTPRQLEILRAYVDPELGGSQDRVAKLLGVSTPAVHNAMGRLMKRLNVSTPAQAAFKLWISEGNEVPPPPTPRDD